MKITIGIIRGEGIGNEIISTAVQLIKEISAKYDLDIEYIDNIEGKVPLIGHEAVHLTGHVITKIVRSLIDKVKARKGAIICGPGGGRFVYDLREAYDLLYKITPVKALKNLADVSGFKKEVRDKIDICMIRPNNFGLYHGKTTYSKENGNEIACQIEKSSYYEVKRFAKVVFQEALKRRKKVTICQKKDAMPGIFKIWEQAFEDTRSDFPDIGMEWILADTYISNSSIPSKVENFDVVTGLNWMMDNAADIAYDGTRGTLYSANFDLDGFGIYQTGHGAAHDIEGRNIGNPIGQLLSVAFMFERSFGMPDIAHDIRKTIEKVVKTYRTPDIYHNSKNKNDLKITTTSEFVEKVIADMITTK